MCRLFLVLLALIPGVVGCSSKKSEPEADVKGTVILDKKPLADGTIMFVTPGQPGDTIDIKNGSFSGKAKVGENRRVEIYAYKDGPTEKHPMTGELMKTQVPIVASAFNTESILNATVKESGDNTFKFEVTSK